MGTAFTTGQAAGVAAALLADRGIAKASDVRQALLGQGALIDVSQLADST